VALKKCCTLPFDEVKNDPNCKKHLEGVDPDNKMEMMKAGMCFNECYYKSKGMINDAGDVVKEKMLEQSLLMKDPDFKDITKASIDMCVTKSELKLLPVTLALNFSSN